MGAKHHGVGAMLSCLGGPFWLHFGHSTHVLASWDPEKCPKPATYPRFGRFGYTFDPPKHVLGVWTPPGTPDLTVPSIMVSGGGLTTRSGRFGYTLAIPHTFWSSDRGLGGPI